MSSMSRARRRPGHIFLLLVAVVTALSGCLRYTESLTIHPDDTVSGIIVLAARQPDAGGAVPAPSPPPDLAVPQPQRASENITVAPFEHQGETGYKVTFDRAGFAEVAAFAPLNGNGGALVISRNGDELQIAMTIDLSYPAPPADRDYLTAYADLSVALTVPGEVTATNGARAGDKITWQLAPFQVNTLSATVDFPAGGPVAAEGVRSVDPLRALLLGSSIIAVLILGWFLLRRRLGRGVPPQRAAETAEPLVARSTEPRTARLRDPWPAAATAAVRGEPGPVAAAAERPIRVRPVHEMRPEREVDGGGWPPPRPPWREHR